jgi:hypothetical protein
MTSSIVSNENSKFSFLQDYQNNIPGLCLEDLV